jgi:hypothetical protein
MGLVEGNRGVDADRTSTTAAIRRAARKKEGRLGFGGLREEEQDRGGGGWREIWQPRLSEVTGKVSSGSACHPVREETEQGFASRLVLMVEGRGLRRIGARALKREGEVACVHDRESSCRALIDPTGWRTGQRKNDKRRRRF